MKLVFIHGWGFDAHIWDAVCAHLPYLNCEKINLGFFGSPRGNISGDILIGHSLGFVHGLGCKRDWRGWIAVNSFARFTGKRGKPGCVPASELTEMCVRLDKDPAGTLRNFYRHIGATEPQGGSDIVKLRAGLDELRDADAGGLAGTIPGLVLAAKNDPLVPMEASMDLAGNNAIIWHETGGHMLPQKDPAWCADKISAFAERIRTFHEACA